VGKTYILNWIYKSKRYAAKWLISLSIFVIVSCSMLKPTPEPTNQIPSPPNENSVIQGELSQSQTEAAKKLIDKASGDSEIYAREGVVNSVITGLANETGENPEKQIGSYFTDNAALYQIYQFEQDFTFIREFQQENGATIRQYQQVIGGIPVYQSDIRIMLDAQGALALVNSNYMPDHLAPQSLKTIMNSSDAEAAFKDLGFELGEGQVPRLVIFSPVMVGEEGQSFLAWLANAGWEEDYGSVLIKDADATLVLTSTDIKTFTYEIRDCEGEEYSSYKPLTSDEIAIKPLLASSYQNNSQNTERINQLKSNFTQIINYYKNAFGYTKYNTSNSDFKILINLRYVVYDEKGIKKQTESPFFWRDDERSIPPLIAFPEQKFEHSIEVFAHEFQHSVTSDFVILETNYKNPESSALNEALSDFFGAIADTSKYRWQTDINGTVYRDLENPTSNISGYSGPDHLDKFIFPVAGKSPEDNYGNGHINSTIVSHALYLLSEGGKKKDINTYGIGIDNAAQIIFYSLPTLNNNAKFYEARNAFLLTCNNLSNFGRFSANYCNQVKNAFAAVGIGSPASESHLQKDLWGVGFGWQISPNMELNDPSMAYENISKTGFVIVKEDFPWDQIQHPSGTMYSLDFGQLDNNEMMASVQKNYLEVLATLSGGPPQTTLSDDEFLIYWRSFLEFIVPRLTKTVHYWQIGDQVNTDAYWAKVRPNSLGVDPEMYGKMLKIAYEVIKSSDIDDLVIVGGLNNLANTNSFGLDPLLFLKRAITQCHPNCFDAVGMQIEWEDTMPDQKRTLSWGGIEISVDMAEYINIVVHDIQNETSKLIPIWITGVGFDNKWVGNLSKMQGSDYSKTLSEMIVKTMVCLSSNQEVDVIFYKDILDYNMTGNVGKDISSIIDLIRDGEPQGSYPVYSIDGDVISQVRQFRYKRDYRPDVTFIWSDDPSIWQLPARVLTLDDIDANVQNFDDFPNAGKITDVSFESEFLIEPGIMVLLSDIDNDAKLVIGDSQPKEYGQFLIENWGNKATQFYLTYDKAKWEPDDYGFLISKDYPTCQIGPQGYRDGGPYAQLYSFETITEKIGSTEFIFELEIPPNGIPDLTHISWDNYKYQFTFLTGPDHANECTDAFWEVLELSEANDFGLDLISQMPPDTDFLVMGDGFTLTYDPIKWKVEGDPNFSYLSSQLHPNCNIYYQNGHGMGPQFSYQNETRTIGNTEFEVHTWTATSNGNVASRVYVSNDFRNDQFISVEGKYPDYLSVACLMDAEEVIILSEENDFQP